MLSSLLVPLSLVFVASSTNIQTNICEPLVMPAVHSLPIENVTAGKPVSINGSTNPDATVKLSVDGASWLSVTADESGRFYAQVMLGAGSHIVSFSAENACETVSGEPIEVTVDPSSQPIDNPVQPVEPAKASQPQQASPEPSPEQAPPDEPRVSPESFRLTITSHRMRTSTTDTSAYIHGRTNFPSSITITTNGKTVAMSNVAATSFGLGIPLAIGENVIMVVAKSGDQTTQHTLYITRTETAPIGEQPEVPWYRTAPGVMAIGTVSILILMLIVVLLIL